MHLHHHGFGTEIRNSLGLWSGSTRLGKAFRDFGMYNADWMSGVILNEYWRHLAGRPAELSRELEEARRSEVESKQAIEEYLKHPPQDELDPFR